jgi:membrane protein YdbS with pleckstrin-like domain
MSGVPHLCFWIIIVSVLIFPVTLLKSPEDFWFLIVASGMATFFAVILIIIGSSIDYKECRKEIKNADFNVINLFMSLGTILFGKLCFNTSNTKYIF